MATTIEDESQGIVREERVYVSLPETERARQLRPPLPPRYEEAVVLPLGPRVCWGGIVAGVVAAFAVILLGTVLGIAIGLSTLNPPLLLNTETLQEFTTTAGIWTGVITLIAYFVAGRVSTKVTDRPDGGAVLHGTLAWILLSVTFSWLVTSGILLGLGRLPEGMQLSLNQFVLPLNLTALTEAELAQRLGLTDPSAVMSRLSDDDLVSALVAATHISQEEVQTTLNDLRGRVTAVQNDPDALNAEIRSFLSDMRARAQQQAPALSEHTQRQVQKGSWITFAIMAVTLLVTIVGSYTGLPYSQRWRGVATSRS
jgi:hypothetical protein